MAHKLLILCLLLVAVLEHKTSGRIIACKQLNKRCLPLTNSCCPGMKCELGLMNEFRCQQSGGLLIRCQTKGQICTPGANDNCCSGLRCTTRLINPRVHECK